MNDDQHPAAVVHFRISEEDEKRFQELQAKFPVTKTVLARRAFQIGLAELEADHARFAASAPPPVDDADAEGENES